MVRSSIRVVVLLMVLVMTPVGCVSVPAQAPELSAELGGRINAIEQSHLALLHSYFDLKRAEVDRFVEDEWIPVFAEELFEDDRIKRVWTEVVASNNATDRVKFITTVGPVMQAKINERRLDLVRPLEEVERRIERALRAEYDQARTINQTVTSFLMSAAGVNEVRTRYLEKIGVSDDDIASSLATVDAAVSTLVNTTRRGRDLVDDAEAFKDRLNGLIERLSGISNT